MVVCLEQGAGLHMAQLMPPPLTVSCFSKIQICFTVLVAAYLGSPRKRVVKRVCVCVYLSFIVLGLMCHCVAAEVVAVYLQDGLLSHITCIQCIDAAYCYRCSVVCLSVCCLLVPSQP